MEKLKAKKIITAILAAILLLGISVAVELFCFNGGIIALDQFDRVQTRISFDALELRDMELTEDGVFHITGESPCFRISDEMYIGKLRIDPHSETEQMCITASNSDKEYNINFELKYTTILRVMEQSDGVTFYVSVNSGNTDFVLDAISVDNSLTLNWLRILTMFSVGLIILYFALFFDIAGRKLHVTYLILTLVIGINMALVIPVGHGYDEQAHFIRAYQFANFDLGFDNEREIGWIENADRFLTYTGTVNPQYNNYDERIELFRTYDSTEYPISEHRDTTAATYPFVPYFFAGLGILVAKLLGMPFVWTFYAGRIFNVLGCALICFFAIKQAKLGKRLLFLMALMPYALFSSSVYTADSLTICFAILAVSLYVNMLLADDGTLGYQKPVAFGLCVSLMAMCKLPYAAFCLLVLSVPMRKFTSKKQAWYNFILVFAVVGVISVLTLLFGAGKGIIQWYQPGMSIVGQVKFILTHPFHYVGTMFSHVLQNWQDYLAGSTVNLGYCAKLGGIWLVLAVAVVAGVAIFDWEEESAQLTVLSRLCCVGAILCSWALVLTALYVSYNVVGAEYIAGVQGRYFFPLILLLLLLLKNNRIKTSVDKSVLNLVCSGTSALLGIVAMTAILANYCM